MKPFKRSEYIENQRFPFRINFVGVDKSSWLVYPHWHEHLEFIKIVKGKIRVQVDEQEFEAEPGTIYFVNSCQIHSVFALEDTESAIHGIVFDKILLQRVMTNMDTEQWISTLIRDRNIRNQYTFDHPIWSVLDHGFLDAIEELHKRDIGYEMLILATLYRMMTAILRLHANDIHSDIIPNHYASLYLKLKPAIDYIEENYTHKITLDEISKSASMSPYHFSREFKKLFGISPLHAVTDFRITQAKLLLLNRNSSIKEIAFEVGFCNIGYFSKVFKERTSFSPLEFRRKFE